MESVTEQQDSEEDIAEQAKLMPEYEELHRAIFYDVREKTHNELNRY